MMTVLKWLMRLVVLLLVLAAVAYPVADWIRTPMNDLARAELTRAGKADRFVPLSAGVMHVRVAGPEDGPVVLFVHGASTGGFAFQRWMKPFADAGFRVIVPDMFGYGYSDRPSAPHDQQFFMDQLGELLAKLNVTSPVHIVGTSMGGAISTDFAVTDPSRIRSVTLIAPAGLGLADSRFAQAMRLLVSPVIGDWIARVLGPTLMTGGLANGPVGRVEGLVAWMNEQAKYRGFAEGQQNTFRNYDIPNRLASYDALGRSGLPVLAVWGTADEVVPFAQSQELLKRVPQAKLVPVDGKPHGLPLIEPEAMVAIVLPFVQANSATAP